MPSSRTSGTRTRLGRVYDETVFEREQPSDIVLTIDTRSSIYDRTGPRERRSGLKAKSGMAIVIDPKTGEILAICKLSDVRPEHDQRMHVRESDEQGDPERLFAGSVFKLVTYRLGSGKASFHAGRHDRRRQRIDRGRKSQIFRLIHIGPRHLCEALAHSSNICAIKTGHARRQRRFLAMVKKMGFGADRIELPAETAGIVRCAGKVEWRLARVDVDRLRNWRDGVANGNCFCDDSKRRSQDQPHIIKEIRRSDEQKTVDAKPEQTQVVTAETAAKSADDAAPGRVSTAPASEPQLNGYTSAGKTGTAWKFDAKSKSVDSSKICLVIYRNGAGRRPADRRRCRDGRAEVGARDGGMVVGTGFREIAAADPAEDEVVDRRDVADQSVGDDRERPPAATCQPPSTARCQTPEKRCERNCKGRRPKAPAAITEKDTEKDDRAEKDENRPRSTPK